MIQWIAFAVVSVVFAIISGKSLRDPRSHGFYRFFAWEAILALIILNFKSWFVNPFSAHQIVSWVLLTVSILPAVWGIVLLRKSGRPVKKREDDSNLLAFEKTTSLVRTGIYKYIRHPLYCSLLLLAWGVFFKAPSWSGILLALAATLFLIATAKADEAECIRFFGSEYQEYMKRTKMFIPFFF